MPKATVNRFSLGPQAGRSTSTHSGNFYTLVAGNFRTVVCRERSGRTDCANAQPAWAAPDRMPELSYEHELASDSRGPRVSARSRDALSVARDARECGMRSVSHQARIHGRGQTMPGLSRRYSPAPVRRELSELP